MTIGKFSKKNGLTKEEYLQFKNFIEAAAAAVKKEIINAEMSAELVRFEALETVKKISLIDKKFLIDALKKDGAEFLYNYKYIVIWKKIDAGFISASI